MTLTPAQQAERDRVIAEIAQDQWDKWRPNEDAQIYAADCIRAALNDPRLNADRVDAERLDWLEDEAQCYWITIQSQPSGDTIYSGHGKTLREAIDCWRSFILLGGLVRARK